MRIEKLYLSNFKNYEELSLRFEQPVNCFVGENGSGKTNLLDAIYFLLLTKSALNTDAQLIRKSSDHFIATTNLQSEDHSFFISATLQPGKKKQFLLNKEPYKKISAHIGKFPVVMISPYDNSLIHDGSEARRRFFDGIIAQMEPSYLDSLLSYAKILKQRNKVLKHYVETRYLDKDLLWSIDKQLIPVGNTILAKRAELMKYFIPVFAKDYGFISGEKEEVRITYQSALMDTDFKDLLILSFEKDKILGRTNVGIHKDDYLFELEDMSLSKFGSQGQQKSFIMALKFANYKLIEENKKFKPILLLDDIFDRMDGKRIGKFVEMVKAGVFGQLFISDTHPERIELLFKDMKDNLAIFNVENGKIVS